MTAEQYLEQIRKLDAVILNKLSDYRHWVDIAEGVGGFSPGERVQSSRNLHRGADAVGVYCGIEAEIETLRAQRQAIISDIESLPYEGYTVIYEIYVKGRMLKELPSLLRRSYEWCKDTKHNALERIQEIIEKKGE